MSTQFLSSLNSGATNPAQHLMAQNYGVGSSTTNNSLKNSSSAAALIQQMSASSSSQTSTSLPPPQSAQLNASQQQQLSALGYQLAPNAQFNSMQAFQGKFL